MNDNKIAVALGIISIGISIVAIAMSNPRNSDSGFDYLGLIVGILAFIVAILAIMFGYNQFIYIEKIKEKHRLLESKINSLSNEFEEKYLKAVGESTEVVSIQHHVEKFINNNVQSGLSKHDSGIMELYYSLDEAIKLKNPYVSANLVNSLTKLMGGISSITELNIPENNFLYDYDRILRERIKENVEIVKNSQKGYLLTNNNGEIGIYKDLDNFLRILNEKHNGITNKYSELS